MDVEHALDPAYAEKCGVVIDELYVSQPDTGEQALEITEALVRFRGIIRSCGRLCRGPGFHAPKLKAIWGTPIWVSRARLMIQALRKLTGAIKTTNTVVIFTNQLRQKIGVMFGNPETTTGGMALRFYSSVRMEIRRIQAIKASGEVTGNRTRVTVKKNKVAPPFKVAEFDIMYNQGISKVGDILDIAVEEEFVDKRGSFFSYGDLRLAQGRENAKNFLIENPETALEIENKIREKFMLPLQELAAAEADSAEKSGAAV